MNVTAQQQQDTLILNLAGKFTFESRKSLQTALTQSVTPDIRKVSLNFSQVPFINSAGLGLLMLTSQDLEKDNIRLALAVPDGHAMNVLQLTNIDQKIPITHIGSQPASYVPAQKSTVSQMSLKPPLALESSEMQNLLAPILDTLEQKEMSLPTLPQVATQVLSLTTDPNASPEQLTGVIQQDPILTSKIFQLTNSAAYGTRHPITSLPQAIAWLGFNSVASLAFALSVQTGIFNARGYEKEARALWAHAIATAFYAKAVAGMVGKNQDTAFLCGLLHSIGKLFVIHTVNQSRSSSALLLPWAAMVTLMEQSYIEVGRQLAEAWNFPPPVKEAINLHDHYSYHLATDSSNGAAITCLARHVATYHIDSVAMSEEMIRVLPVAEALRIPHDVMDEIFAIKTVIQQQIDSLLL